jgi:hypothetical protein
MHGTPIRGEDGATLGFDGASIRTIPCFRSETWGTQVSYGRVQTARSFGRDDKLFPFPLKPKEGLNGPPSHVSEAGNNILDTPRHLR